MPEFDPRRQSDYEYQEMRRNRQRVLETQGKAAAKQYEDQWRQGGGGVPLPVSAAAGGAGAAGGVAGAGAAQASPFDQLLELYQQGYTAATEANEARYAEARALQEGMGEQEAADIRQAYRGVGTAAGQDLVSRGLTGTTIGPSVQAGIKREETSALGRLDERVRGEKVGLIERREDLYPDLGMLLEIGKMAGAGGFGGAGAGGGGAAGQTVVGGLDLGQLAGSGLTLQMGGKKRRRMPAPVVPGAPARAAATGRRRMPAPNVPSPREEFYSRRGAYTGVGATPISARARYHFG